MTISVDPVNEQPPVFQANTYDGPAGDTVMEDVPEGTLITTYDATDADIAPHDVVKYEIIGKIIYIMAMC